VLNQWDPGNQSYDGQWIDATVMSILAAEWPSGR
jgi:hypothetical protein